MTKNKHSSEVQTCCCRHCCCCGCTCYRSCCLVCNRKLWLLAGSPYSKQK